MCTTLRTLLAMARWRTSRVPSTVVDSSIRLWAQWTTTSIPVMAASRDSGSMMSQRTISTGNLVIPATFAVRATPARTLVAPARHNSSAVQPPIKPAAPVTRILGQFNAAANGKILCEETRLAWGERATRDRFQSDQVRSGRHADIGAPCGLLFPRGAPISHDKGMRKQQARFGAFDHPILFEQLFPEHRMHEIVPVYRIPDRGRQDANFAEIALRNLDFQLGQGLQ